MIIVDATVLLTNGVDEVWLKTDLPCPFPKEADPSQSPLRLEFKARQGTGYDYCRHVFGIIPKIIDVR